jgi:hypothetical protein
MHLPQPITAQDTFRAQADNALKHEQILFRNF